MKKKQNPAPKRRADIIKEALREFILEEANNKAKKLKLAAFLEMSVSGVDALIYQNKGSVTSWINALLYRFKMEPKEVVESLREFSRSQRRERSNRRSDELWFALDEVMTEDDKVYWASLLHHAAELKKTLG